MLNNIFIVVEQPPILPPNISRGKYNLKEHFCIIGVKNTT